MTSANERSLIWHTSAHLREIDFTIFSVEQIRARHADSSREGIFARIKSPHWVNILAITSEEEFIFVRQHRHGINSITTELPGGMIDSGETSLAAAQRELIEETGYASSSWHYLGSVFPNPAIQTNQCFLYLAVNARLSADPSWDPNEVIETLLLSIERTKRSIQSGEINHALVLANFALFQQLSQGWKLPTHQQLIDWSPPQPSV